MAENKFPPLQENKSLIHLQFTDSHQTNFPQFTARNFTLERGPRYNEYSILREKTLRSKIAAQQQREIIMEKETIKKVPNRQILKPQKCPPKRRQSMPDFSPLLRKENRKPPLAPANQRSPPPEKLLRGGGRVGGQSVKPSEKRIGAGRKSCSSIVELKGLVSGVNGENGVVGERRVTRALAQAIAGNWKS